MTVEETRQKLIQLEIQDREEREALVQERKRLQELLARVDTKDREGVERQQSIRDARIELRRKEALEAGKALVESQQLSREGYIEQFKQDAQGRLWFEGTGNDDEILPHQWLGMMFGAVARRWILGDEPGLGKTRTATGWLDLIRAKRVIIVCEAGICNQFAGEVMNLAPHRKLTNLYKKTPLTRHELLDEAVSNDGVIVVNYEMWRTDKDALAKMINWQPDTVIVDEAHNIKSKRTSAYKNIDMLITADNMCPGCGYNIKGLWTLEGLQRTPPRKIPKPCPGCGWTYKAKGDETVYRNQLVKWLSTKSIHNVLFMTGTPILNDPADIFPLLHLCDPILFTTENSFRDSYCRKDHHADKWEFRQNAVENLRPLIEGRFLARSCADAKIVLPKQQVHIVRVDLDKNAYPLQYRTIRQITKEAQIQLDSGDQLTIMHLMSLITRKRQANVWPGGIKVKAVDEETGEEYIVFDASVEVNESVKIDAMIEQIMACHAEGKRQVVFSQFSTAIVEVQRRLDELNIRAVSLVGETPPKLRDKIKTNFYRALGETPEYDVVVANYKTGGTGLNLTGATATHILDEEWNPGKRDQAYGRTKRMGQTEETVVYVYRIPGTVDTWMSNGIHRKEMMISGFNEAMTDDHEISMDTFIEALQNGEIL